MTSDSSLDWLLDRIGYRFQDHALLLLALTHRSWCAENSGSDSNERLEFLGDAVLGLAVTEYLHQQFPDLPEGELAPMRASVVNAAALADVAAGIELGQALRLGKGEDGSGGRNRRSILSDAIEAVFGAVYLDGGWKPARNVVLAVITPRIVGPGGIATHHDFKTRLQELSVIRFANEMPVYDVTGSGPDHAKLFRAEVRLVGKVWGEGSGRSKKEAEQAAAGAAYAALAANVGPDDDNIEQGEPKIDA